MTKHQMALFENFLKSTSFKKDDPEYSAVYYAVETIILDNKVGIVDGRLALITNVVVRGEEK